MSVIAIVRHGETDWNRERRIQGRTEVPLNHTGREQAAATARLLASPYAAERLGELTRLVSSPLGRAVETAMILAQTMGLPAPSIETELYERDFGPAEGLPVAEVHERWPGLEIPGAEPLARLAERTAAVFERTLAEHSGTVIVAHGAMIRAGLSHIGGADIPRVLNGEVWVLDRRDAAARVYRLDPANEGRG